MMITAWGERSVACVELLVTVLAKDNIAGDAIFCRFASGPPVSSSTLAILSCHFRIALSFLTMLTAYNASTSIILLIRLRIYRDPYPWMLNASIKSRPVPCMSRNESRFHPLVGFHKYTSRHPCSLHLILNCARVLEFPCNQNLLVHIASDVTIFWSATPSIRT